MACLPDEKPKGPYASARIGSGSTSCLDLGQKHEKPRCIGSGSSVVLLCDPAAGGGQGSGSSCSDACLELWSLPNMKTVRPVLALENVRLLPNRVLMKIEESAVVEQTDSLKSLPFVE